MKACLLISFYLLLNPTCFNGMTLHTNYKSNYKQNGIELNSHKDYKQDLSPIVYFLELICLEFICSLQV